MNDGTALQRECETALRAADRGPDSSPDPTADEEELDDVERGYHMGQCLGLVSGGIKADELRRQTVRFENLKRLIIE